MENDVTADPALAAVLDQLREASGEDWAVADMRNDCYVLLRKGVWVTSGTRESTLNYMLAYIAGIHCAWRDFTVRCPAMGWC